MKQEKLDVELMKLDKLISGLPELGRKTLIDNRADMYVLDLIMIAALKRTLSLAKGFQALAISKNMTCVRAMIRMQLDTVSRLLAYTYVSEPSKLATEVMSGKPLNRYKCRDGHKLQDRYLIEKMAERYPWVMRVYKYTSGYVHFSEKQLFDSISSMGDGSLGKVSFDIRADDLYFPEESWIEAVSCFNEMLSILEEILLIYSNEISYQSKN